MCFGVSYKTFLMWSCRRVLDFYCSGHEQKDWWKSLQQYYAGWLDWIRISQRVVASHPEELWITNIASLHNVLLKTTANLFTFGTLISFIEGLEYWKGWDCQCQHRFCSDSLCFEKIFFLFLVWILFKFGWICCVHCEGNSLKKSVPVVNFVEKFI